MRKIIDTDEKKDLEQIVNATLKEISSIEAIYLFGSIVKGKENEKSDYDICSNSKRISGKGFR